MLKYRHAAQGLKTVIKSICEIKQTEWTKQQGDSRNGKTRQSTYKLQVVAVDCLLVVAREEIQSNFYLQPDVLSY